jgi:predicted nucleic acid-binding protein
VKVLVDTPIWSFAFRRSSNAENACPKPIVKELIELIREDRAVLIGPVRQEVLSGISNQKQFDLLREKLKPFEGIAITSGDYELAADFNNQCRGKGIQGSHIDFLICAVASRNGIPIFTTDNDFSLYAKHIDIILYVPRDSGQVLQEKHTDEV